LVTPIVEIDLCKDLEATHHIELSKTLLTDKIELGEKSSSKLIYYHNKLYPRLINLISLFVDWGFGVLGFCSQEMCR